MIWSQRLFIGQMACVAVLLFDVIVDKSGIISWGVADLILLAILYLVYSKKEFQLAYCTKTIAKALPVEIYVPIVNREEVLVN